MIGEKNSVIKIKEYVEGMNDELNEGGGLSDEISKMK